MFATEKKIRNQNALHRHICTFHTYVYENESVQRIQAKNSAWKRSWEKWANVWVRRDGNGEWDWLWLCVCVLVSQIEQIKMCSVENVCALCILLSSVCAWSVLFFCVFPVSFPIRLEWSYSFGLWMCICVRESFVCVWCFCSRPRVRKTLDIGSRTILQISSIWDLAV